MIVVDSSVWIDYFNGDVLPHTEKLANLLGQREIVVFDLIMVEVLQGMRKKREFNATLEVLDSFKFISTTSRNVALQSAKNNLILLSKGFTVRKTIDVIIATRCILGGFELLHNDRDFVPCVDHLGLRTISY
jgi:predicted nucleic acid-binding protein